MTVIYEEQSKRMTSATMLVGALVGLVIAAILYSYMNSLAKGVWLVDEFLIEFIILAVFLKQALSRYTYVLTENELIIKERSFFRTRTLTIPYEMIDGVFPFKRQWVTTIRYRYKYRKASSLDTRPVYALAFATVKGMKLQHGRVLMKAEPQFYKVLSQYVDRIDVPEADVILYATVREDAVKHGEDVKEYYAQIMKGSEE